MQFAVPQFLEEEGKIFAFLTVRQFVILLLTGGTIVVIVASNVGVLLMIGLIILVLSVAISLAFVKINGHMFQDFFVFMLNYMSKPPIRVWRKEEITQEDILRKEKESQEGDRKEIGPVAKRPMDRHSLAHLSLIVDTGGVYKEDN